MVTYTAVADKESMYRGDYEIITYTIYEGTAVKDITGATFKWTMRDRWDDATFLIQITGIAPLVPAAGTVAVILLETYTNTLDPGCYPIDLEMTLGGHVYTVYQSGYDLYPDVT